MPPSAEITDERVKAEMPNKSNLIVNIQVCVESWDHPLGRPRQLLVSSQQDTATLRLWTTSGGCYTGSRSSKLLSFDLRAKSKDGLEKDSFRPYQSINGAGKEFKQNKW